MILRAYKYRLMPSEKQREQIEQHFGCCRLIWNLALAAKKQAYESNRVNLTRYDLQKQLVELKKEYKWLYEVNSQSIQGVLLNMDRAYKSFFKGAGFPKFKKKIGYQRFSCPQRVSIKESIIKLPNIGEVNLILSRKFEGKIKTVTISKTPTGKYFASILVETGCIKSVPNKVNAATTIGIDVGIKSFVVTSDGKFFELNRRLKNSLQRLKCLQQRASRKKKGSSNRKKSNKCVAILHEKIANQRTDYIHKITTQLIRDNQAESFVIEDLNIVGMLKNRKLSQAISDVSFGELFRQLKYKCEWYGKNLIVIGRFEPSSKMCSNCNAINDTLKLADREWMCANCGIIHERDFNAAKNIRNMGLKQYSPEGIRVEPVESRRLRQAKKQENVQVCNYQSETIPEDLFTLPPNF